MLSVGARFSSWFCKRIPLSMAEGPPVVDQSTTSLEETFHLRPKKMHGRRIFPKVSSVE